MEMLQAPSGFGAFEPVQGDTFTESFEKAYVALATAIDERLTRLEQWVREQQAPQASEEVWDGWEPRGGHWSFTLDGKKQWVPDEEESVDILAGQEVISGIRQPVDEDATDSYYRIEEEA